MQEVKLLGAKKLAKQLRHLDKKGARKALRSGVGAAVKVLRKSIRGEIPPDAKSIKKSVGSKVKINKKDGIIAKVGLNIGKKKGRGYAPQAMMYVAGTVERKTEAGISRGRMPANPVVQRGLAKGEESAKRQMIDKMGQVIKSEAGKT